MKIQYSMVIELAKEVDAAVLKRALEQIPDNAHISTDVLITEPDRPYESRRTQVSLNAIWETPQ
jgi:hypothetical protein